MDSKMRYFGFAVGFAFAVVWMTIGLGSAIVCGLVAGLGYGAVIVAERARANETTTRKSADSIAQMLDESAEALEAAETRAPGSLQALAEAYRTYAIAHPHLYRLATERPLPRAALPPGLEDRAALPLLRACGGDLDLARSTWAFAHGMVILEIHGRFPEDADLGAAWKRGLEALHP